jgi:hypothetical protein
MKKTFSLFFILITFASCKSLDEYNSNVQLINKVNSASYTCRGTGFSKNSDDCKADAEMNVFNVLLFKGFSGTDLQIPLVDNEMKSKNDNEKFYKDFFNNHKYRDYITSEVSIVSPLKKVKGGYTCQVEFTINLNSLKNHLQQNGIIRKFGF